MAVPLLDKTGKDTLWETVFYSPERTKELKKALTLIYVLLLTEGDLSATKHLDVDRIDYCAFGNSNPFRVRIINRYNDNYDYFYIKTADASRVYGLELEHLLSPNRISYFVEKDTLIEEHIAGIPGDVFMDRWLGLPGVNKVRLAKEFVKFNERCHLRLLGDMRSYNYVVDITPDFDDVQYRIRAIDFDQQCYEGRMRVYMPQFFKENLPLVKMGMDLINQKTVEQYQNEERFNALGVTQYGQMTAGSYMYIGPQGIVHGTAITVLNAVRKIKATSPDPSFSGGELRIPLPASGAEGSGEGSYLPLFVTSGLGGMSGAQPKAGNIAAMLFVSAKVSPLALLPQGRVEAEERVLNMVKQMDEEGFGNCTNTGACEVECPKGISLENIARMNREYMSAVALSEE
jgi:hypothetical protein